MGDRPALSAAEARAALADSRGCVRAGRRAPSRPPLTDRTSVSFATWERMEASLLDRLASGEPSWDVLGAPRYLPLLRGVPWAGVAGALEFPAGAVSRGAAAMAHFGDGIRMALGEAPVPRARPWAVSFDRAEARSPRPEVPARILGDFLADRVWDMSWVQQGSFARARTSLGALATIAVALAGRLEAIGLRPDRAMAEAVFVVDLASTHPIWAEVASRLVLPVRSVAVL
jgi:hypothetical protein